jgi:hypothetical protein
MLVACAVLLLCACNPPAAPPAEAPAAPAQAARAARVADILVSTPSPNARVTSPLVVSGFARGPWYFEALFPAQLIGPNDEIIAEAPAQAQTDWMTEDPVEFRAEFTFNVTRETRATLFLQEAMPPDADRPAEAGRPVSELRIPIILAPN